MPTLHECCRILEVEPSASVAEIKQSYRDLARVWHPDRFTGDPRLRARAEERLREINGAYETLLRLRTNGSQESTESQGADEKARQPSRPPSAPKPGKSHLSKTAVFVIAGIVIFFSGVRRVVENNSRTTPPARPQQSVFGAPASRTTTPARPQRGAAERSPSAFDDIIPANRLRAYFTVGSTKDEVIAIQGSPSAFSDRKFRYGLSTVSFEHGRVTKWETYSSSPLKARLETSVTSPR